MSRDMLFPYNGFAIPQLCPRKHLVYFHRFISVRRDEKWHDLGKRKP